MHTFIFRHLISLRSVCYHFLVILSFISMLYCLKQKLKVDKDKVETPNHPLSCIKPTIHSENMRFPIGTEWCKVFTVNITSGEIAVLNIWIGSTRDLFLYTIWAEVFSNVLNITQVRFFFINLPITYESWHMMPHSDDRPGWPKSSQSYLAQDAADILSTDQEPRVIKVVHNLFKSAWNLFVLLQVTAAKLGIIFAEAQRLLRMERRLVVQTLRVGICVQEVQEEPKQKVKKLGTPESY